MATATTMMMSPIREATDLEKSAKKRGRAYQCLRCLHKAGREFIEVKGRMECHILKDHLGRDDVPFFCSLCQFRCMKRQELDDHLIRYRKHAIIAKQSGVDPLDQACLRENVNPYKMGPKDYLILDKEDSLNYWRDLLRKRQAQQADVFDPLSQALDEAFPGGFNNQMQDLLTMSPSLISSSGALPTSPALANRVTPVLLASPRLPPIPTATWTVPTIPPATFSGSPMSTSIPTAQLGPVTAPNVTPIPASCSTMRPIPAATWTAQTVQVAALATSPTPVSTVPLRSAATPVVPYIPVSDQTIPPRPAATQTVQPVPAADPRELPKFYAVPTMPSIPAAAASLSQQGLQQAIRPFLRQLTDLVDPKQLVQMLTSSEVQINDTRLDIEQGVTNNVGEEDVQEERLMSQLLPTEDQTFTPQRVDNWVKGTGVPSKKMRSPSPSSVSNSSSSSSSSSPDEGDIAPDNGEIQSEAMAEMTRRLDDNTRAVRSLEKSVLTLAEAITVLTKTMKAEQRVKQSEEVKELGKEQDKGSVTEERGEKRSRENKRNESVERQGRNKSVERRGRSKERRNRSPEQREKSHSEKDRSQGRRERSRERDAEKENRSGRQSDKRRKTEHREDNYDRQDRRLVFDRLDRRNKNRY